MGHHLHRFASEEARDAYNRTVVKTFYLEEEDYD